MNPIILPFQKSLRQLCEQFRVERLYLFGSGTNQYFQPERSDLDFLVTLEDQSPGDYADNYLGLAAALEKLFHRRIDLVSERAIRNPCLRETIFKARQLVYERDDEKAAA